MYVRISAGEGDKLLHFVLSNGRNKRRIRKQLVLTGSKNNNNKNTVNVSVMVFCLTYFGIVLLYGKNKMISVTHATSGGENLDAGCCYLIYVHFVALQISNNTTHIERCGCKTCAKYMIRL